MAVISESAAELLDPTQAADLTRVIELQAAWENLRDNPPAGPLVGALRERQRGYDTFRTALAAYTSKYPPVDVPEVRLNTPDRLGAWCRTVRTLVRRAGTVVPVHTLTAARRLTDRIAARLGVAPVVRGTADSVEAALRELDAVVEWCEAQAGPKGGIGRKAAA